MTCTRACGTSGTCSTWRNAGRRPEIQWFLHTQLQVGGLKKRTVRPGAVYRHFKGREYRALYVARHSETMEELVVYQQLYGDGGVWVRPLDMFLGTVERDGETPVPL